MADEYDYDLLPYDATDGAFLAGPMEATTLADAGRHLRRYAPPPQEDDAASTFPFIQVLFGCVAAMLVCTYCVFYCSDRRRKLSKVEVDRSIITKVRL